MLESDGTEIEDDEVLEEYNTQILILLSADQVWVSPTPVTPVCVESQLTTPERTDQDAAEPTQPKGTFQYRNKTINLSSKIPFTHVLRKIKILYRFNCKSTDFRMHIV